MNKSHIAVICNMALYMDFHPTDFDRIRSLSEIDISTVRQTYLAQPLHWDEHLTDSKVPNL